MINPELEPFVAYMAEKWSPVAPDAPVQEKRAHFEVIAREMDMPMPPEIDFSDVRMVETPAGEVRVRIFRHRDDGVQPGLVYLHGGGWMQGSPETHAYLTAHLAARTKMTVISVDYAKTPERVFPDAVQQCTAVAHWAFDAAADLGIDPSRIAIGGDSAGGNLAAAVTLNLRGTQHRLNAQLLIYPVVDFTFERPSFTENADGPGLQTSRFTLVTSLYLPDRADWTNPLAAPLQAESHAGLPPAFVAVAEHDPLRDDGLAYAEALEGAGVPVTLDRGTGLIHGYTRALHFSTTVHDTLDAMGDWLAAQGPAPAEAGRVSESAQPA